MPFGGPFRAKVQFWVYLRLEHVSPPYLGVRVRIGACVNRIDVRSYPHMSQVIHSFPQVIHSFCGKTVISCGKVAFV